MRWNSGVCGLVPARQPRHFSRSPELMMEWRSRIGVVEPASRVGSRCPSFNRIGTSFIFKRATAPRRASRGWGAVHTWPLVSQLADMPQPGQRAMALPLSFAAPSGAGILAGQELRDGASVIAARVAVLLRRRLAYSALLCARLVPIPLALVPAHPAPAGTAPVAQVSANTFG